MNAAPKFTPGPWWVSPRDVSFYREDGTYDTLREGIEPEIANWPTHSFLQFEIEGPAPVSGRGWLTGPDALLVAAAPDLYAALELALEPCERGECCTVCDEQPHRDDCSAVAALAKARGEK